MICTRQGAASRTCDIHILVISSQIYHVQKLHTVSASPYGFEIPFR